MKPLFLPLLITLSLPGTADIFTMKDGTKLDAVIVGRTLEEFELEVKVTKSMTQKRTIKRDDIANREIVSLTDTIFEEQIAGLVPMPPFQSVEDYEVRIKAVNSYLTAHERTASGIKAKAIKKKLEAERDLVATGGMRVKLGKDGLVTAENVEKDLLGIESQAAAGKFEQLVKARAYLAGLRQYDLLERNFLGTKAQREALPLMRKLAATYAQLLDRELQSVEAREKEGKMAMEQLSGSDRQRAERANEERAVKFAQLLEREEKAGYTWFSVDTRDERSLGAAIDELNEEVERLAQLQEDLKDYKDSAELYRQGWLAADAKEKENLEKILDELDEVSTPQEYLDKLVDRFDPAINNPPAEEDSPEEEEGSEEDSETTE